MPATPIDIARAGQAQKKAALDALEANAEAGAEIRRENDKREFRQALHNLAEGLRGAIRVAPLAAVVASLALGMTMARRRRA